MRTIKAEEITRRVATLCIEANTCLPADVKAALEKAREEEPWPLAKQTLGLLRSNLDVAAAKELPICQDTGMACVFVELGQDVHVEGDLEAAVNEGVRRGYGDGYLRKSVVGDPLRRVNTEDNTPAVDTRTAQQKEIDEAIANGTWGIEYTTCQKCGYHNWTRQGNVYVCDTCGNETTTVVSEKGVKGYVGSGAIAAIAPTTAAPESRYATAAEAQAAADKREADYAAAVAAYQKQIAAQNAAYLAALGK